MARQEHSSAHPRQRNDFQGLSGAEMVFQYLKPGDCAIAAKLLGNTAILHMASQAQSAGTQAKIKALDIGGANGLMMITLLRTLEEQATLSKLKLTTDVFISEPKVDRVAEYKIRTDEYNRMQAEQRHLFRASIFGTSGLAIEGPDIELPTVDLILASHVLYYNQPSWIVCDSTEGHFFTKLLYSLSENGVLCIVIQSTQMDQDQTHELLEDLVYPLIEKVKHGNNPYYATSEMLDQALSNYRKQFIIDHDGAPPAWKIKNEYATTEIPLGDINFERGDNDYQQNKDVEALFGFYLKGRKFCELETIKKEYFLRTIRQHFSKGGSFAVKHVNKVYTIEMTPELHARIHSKIANVGHQLAAGMK
ncbi:MAG: hypothetical protein K0U29_02840 [Gammaproteobacteria bacterium]|nr:hypothetical protein [Gammaproteobacteria bacterium]MCH9743847.1 hypothetical protein [Gammaproteobacteria bacterium]